MCLAVPGKIIEIYEKDDLRMAQVDFGGIRREICLSYVPEAQVSQYCVIHVGFAISLLSESEAQTAMETLREIAKLDDELRPEEVYG